MGSTKITISTAKFRSRSSSVQFPDMSVLDKFVSLADKSESFDRASICEGRCLELMVLLHLRRETCKPPSKQRRRHSRNWC